MPLHIIYGPPLTLAAQQVHDRLAKALAPEPVLIYPEPSLLREPRYYPRSPQHRSKYIPYTQRATGNHPSDR